MADPMFDGTVLNFAGSGVANLISLEYEDGPPEVPISGATDSFEKVLIGIHSETVTAEVIGTPSIAAKAKGALAVAWTDSGTITFANAQVVDISNGGEYNGQITKKITIRPSNS